VLSFRVFHLHDNGESSVLEIEQLTIDGTQVSFVMGSKETQMPTDGGPICQEIVGGAEQCTPTTTIAGWYREGAVTVTGTAKRDGTGFRLEFQRPDRRRPSLVMSCTEQWIDVAPANAHLTVGTDCAWSLPAERVKVLACAMPREPTATPFAPAPGIEEIDPDSETTPCGGPFYRRVPADGSVAQALAR
jgi:hypothetical protein